MSTIAVVGTEGSGKTVLLTVLAKWFSDGKDGILITPQNRATNKFVEEVWNTLTSKEWPPSTPPGVLVHLHWKVEAPGGFTANLNVNDCAGQDLRYLFAEEGLKDSGLSEKIQSLVKSIRDADIVLFVVNLRDFVAEKDPNRLTDNQWFLQYAMDFVKQSGEHKRFCLVFTQADQYPRYLEQHGSWREVARSRLPQVFGAFLRQGRVEVLGVSAVRDTIVVDDPNVGARRVPRPGFTSEGIDKVGQWVTGQVRTAHKSRAADPARRAGLAALAASALMTYLLLWIFFPVVNVVNTTKQIEEPVFEDFDVYKNVTKYYLLGFEVPFGVPYEVKVFDRTEKRQVGTRLITVPETVVNRLGIGAGGWFLLLVMTAASTAATYKITLQHHLNKLGNESA
jgi:hypothetical protein